MVYVLFCFGRKDGLKKTFTLYSNQAGCDDAQFNIRFVTSFLNHFFHLMDLLRNLHVENKSKARFITNEVP